MADNSVDNLVKSFETPTIPPIIRKPTYYTIHSLHKLFNLNAASFRTNLGCGTLRHLCPTLFPTVYATLSVTLVLTPPNPGATPVIPEGATGPEAAPL